MAEEREQIRERLSIETLVGEHVQLSRSGQNLKGLCPFHKEKSPSFLVSPARGSFHCFGCGAGGDIFRFYMLINKVEFPDALRALAARTGVELDPGAAVRKAKEARVHEVLEAATLYFQQALMSPAGAAARSYLAARGLDRQTVERFALGYLPDWGEGLRRDLPGRGVSVEELLDAGVLYAAEGGREPFSPFHGRLLFPIRDLQGRVCGFGGRILGEGQPKYLNSRQSTVFDKSATLYTIDRASDAIRAAGEAVIVEGYMDALAAHQAGFANVVASLGTAITVRHLQTLAKLTSRVVLALDADPAGARAAAEAGVRATIALGQTQPAPQPGVSLGKPARQPLELRIATLPEGRDPDEVIAEDPSIWRYAIGAAAPALDHLFDLVLAGLDRRAPSFAQDMLGQLLPLVGQLPGVGMQQPYLERLAELTRIDTATLRGELARLRGQSRRQAGGMAAGERTRGGTQLRGQSELARLREQTVAGDPLVRAEEDLLKFLLAQMPLDGPALAMLEGLQFGDGGRQAILAELLDAHRQGRQAAAFVAALPDGQQEAAQALLERGPTGLAPIAAEKVASAIATYRSRLERLAQSARLREQGALLDQVDAETAHTLLPRMQELVASRNDLTRRMLEEQARYHLR